MTKKKQYYNRREIWISRRKISFVISLIYSSTLIQQEHYITETLARLYLQNTRKKILSEFGKSICNKTYVLNILISNRLTKSCFELITTDEKSKNMDMIFNPKKTKEEEILSAIFQALYTKCQSWNEHIKRGCKNKNIRTYGEVRNKVKNIDNATYIFHSESVRLKRGILT